MTNAKFTVIIIMMLHSTNRSTAQDLSWPRLEFHPNEDAHLPCIAQGDATGFFWKKGDLFESSKPIAYKFSGLPSQAEDGRKDKFSILEDGTLIVHRVSHEDEGKYFCRIVSESSECHAGVTLILEVKTDDFSLRIEECSSMKSCVIPAKYYEPLALTCAAYRAPSSTTLKWFNGSTEIPDSLSTLDVINTGRGLNMTKRLVLEQPWSSLLSCKATSESIPEKSACICTYVIPMQNDFPNNTSSCSNGCTVVLVIFVVLLLTLSTFVVYMYCRGTVKERGKNQDPEISAEEEKFLQETTTDGQTKPRVRRGFGIVKMSILDTLDAEVYHWKSDSTQKTGEITSLTNEKSSLEESKNQLEKKMKKLSVWKEEQTTIFRTKINDLAGQIEAATSNPEVLKILGELGDWLYQIRKLHGKIPWLKHLNDDVEELGTNLEKEGEHPLGEQETQGGMVKISKKLKGSLKEKIDALSSKIKQAEEKEKIQMILKEVAQWYTGTKDHPISSIPGIKKMTVHALNASLEEKLLDLSEQVKDAEKKEDMNKTVGEFSIWQTVLQNHKHSYPIKQELFDGTLKAALDKKMETISKTIISSSGKDEIEKVLAETEACHTVLHNYKSVFPGLKDLPSKTLKAALDKKMETISKTVISSSGKDEIEKVLAEIEACHTVLPNYKSVFPGNEDLPSKTLKAALDKKMETISKTIISSSGKDGIEKVLADTEACHSVFHNYKSVFPGLKDLPSKTLKDALDKKMETISKTIISSSGKDEIEKVLAEIGACHTVLHSYKSVFPGLEDLPSKTLTSALDEKMILYLTRITEFEKENKTEEVIKEIGAWHTATQKYKSIYEKDLQSAFCEKIVNRLTNVKEPEEGQIEKVLKEISLWRTAMAKCTSSFPEYKSFLSQKISAGLENDEVKKEFSKITDLPSVLKAYISTIPELKKLMEEFGGPGGSVEEDSSDLANSEATDTAQPS